MDDIPENDKHSTSDIDEDDSDTLHGHALEESDEGEEYADEDIGQPEDGSSLRSRRRPQRALASISMVDGELVIDTLELGPTDVDRLLAAEESLRE